MADDLRADFDQLLAQLVSDHGSAARVFMKLLADDEFLLTLRDAASAR